MAAAAAGTPSDATDPSSQVREGRGTTTTTTSGRISSGSSWAQSPAHASSTPTGRGLMDLDLGLGPDSYYEALTAAVDALTRPSTSGRSAQGQGRAGRPSGAAASEDRGVQVGSLNRGGQVEQAERLETKEARSMSEAVRLLSQAVSDAANDSGAGKGLNGRRLLGALPSEWAQGCWVWGARALPRLRAQMIDAVRHSPDAKLAPRLVSLVQGLSELEIPLGRGERRWLYKVLSNQIMQGAFGPDWAVSVVHSSADLLGSASPYTRALLRCLCCWLASLPSGPEDPWLDERSAVRLILLLANARLACGAAPGAFLPPSPASARAGASSTSVSVSMGAAALSSQQFRWQLERARSEGRAVSGGVKHWPGEEGTDEWGEGDEAELVRLEAEALQGREEPNGPPAAVTAVAAAAAEEYQTPTPQSPQEQQQEEGATTVLRGSVAVPSGLSLGEALVLRRLSRAARLKRMARAWGVLELGTVAAHWRAAGMPVMSSVKLTLSAQFHLQQDQPPLLPLPAAQLIQLQLIGLEPGEAELEGTAKQGPMCASDGYSSGGGEKGEEQLGVGSKGSARAGGRRSVSSSGDSGEDESGQVGEGGGREGRVLEWLQLYCQKVLPLSSGHMPLAHLTSIIACTAKIQHHLPHLPILPTACPATSNPAMSRTGPTSVGMVPSATLPATAALLQAVADPTTGPPGLGPVTACLTELAASARATSLPSLASSSSDMLMGVRSSSGRSREASGWRVLEGHYIAISLLRTWLLRCAVCDMATVSNAVRDPRQKALYQQYEATSAIMYTRSGTATATRETLSKSDVADGTGSSASDAQPQLLPQRSRTSALTGQQAPPRKAAKKGRIGVPPRADTSSNDATATAAGLRPTAEQVSLAEVQLWASQLGALLQALASLGPPHNPTLVNICAVALLRLARHGPHVVPLRDLLEGVCCLAALGFEASSGLWSGTFLGLLHARVISGALRRGSSEWAPAPNIPTPSVLDHGQTHGQPSPDTTHMPASAAEGGAPRGSVLQPVLQLLEAVAHLEAVVGPVLDSALSAELLTYHLAMGLAGAARAPALSSNARSENKEPRRRGRPSATGAQGGGSGDHGQASAAAVECSGGAQGAGGGVAVNELVALLEGMQRAGMPGSSALGARLVQLVGDGVSAPPPVMTQGATAQRSEQLQQQGEDKGASKSGTAPVDDVVSGIFGGTSGPVLMTHTEARSALSALFALGLPPPPHVFARLMAVGMGVCPRGDHTLASGSISLVSPAEPSGQARPKRTQARSRTKVLAGVDAAGDGPAESRALPARSGEGITAASSLSVPELAAATRDLAVLAGTPQALKVTGAQQGQALRDALVALHRQAAAVTAGHATSQWHRSSASSAQSNPNDGSSQQQGSSSKKHGTAVAGDLTDALAVVLKVLFAVADQPATAGPFTSSHSSRSAEVDEGDKAAEGMQAGLRGVGSNRVPAGEVGKRGNGRKSTAEVDDFIEARLQALKAQRAAKQV